MFGLAWRAWGRDQQDLTDRLKENGIIQTEAVELAFRLVDRALFIPGPAAPAAAAPSERAVDGANAAAAEATRRAQERAQERSQQAYIDGPVRVLLPGGGAVHLSAPHMYGLVLERLGLEPGMSFLSVGSGSGYFNCLASVMVGRGGKSHGVERVEEVVLHARRCAQTWRKQMEAMRKEQRRAAAEAAGKVKKAAAKDDETKQPTSEGGANADMKDVELPARAAEMSLSRASSSGRSSPMSLTRDDAEDESSSANAAPAITSPASYALPRPFTAIELSSLSGGPARRGIIGPAADMPSMEVVGGDAEASAALRRSILPLDSILQSFVVAPVPSPSPAPSTHSGDSEESDDAMIPTAWMPAVPVPKQVPEPQYIVGDAFDLDPAVCGLYDRIYIGAATPSSYIPLFTSLLHPGGRLVGPFDSEMLLISKRRDGSTAKEKVSDVSYAPMVLPDTNVPPTQPRPQLHFPQPIFSPPYGFSCLPPSMKAAIDAMLMLQRRDGRECLMGRLPLSLLMEIMTYLPIDSYMDRKSGDVTWAPDAWALLCAARTKQKIADEMTGATTSAQQDNERLEAAEKLLREALGHVEQVRDWLELRLPTTMPADAESPVTAAASAESASVGGFDTDLPALRELRADPTRVGSGRSINDPIPDQCVQLYWLIHWSLLHVLTANKNAAAMRVAKRLLALRPNDAVAWRMLALNAFKSRLLPEAIHACDQALKLVDASGTSSGQHDPNMGREDVLGLKKLIELQMPAYRRDQQQMSARLMQVLLNGLMGHHEGEEEGEEGEEEEEEEEHEVEP